MKRFLILVLTLALLLLTACGGAVRVRDFEHPTRPAAQPTAPPTETTAAQTPTIPTETVVIQTSAITPALYKVTDGSGNVVWLFGSIHVGLSSFYPLPDYVASAYENADALAVECDVLAFEKDLNAQMDALENLLYYDGTRISDHISQELYTQAVEILEETGTYSSTLDMYKPILWSSFIDNTLYERIGADSTLGIDLHFLNNAYDTGKEILEVESVQFQYDMLAGFSEELQTLLLEGSVESYGDPAETEEQITALMEAWSTGDVDALTALLSEESEFESEEEELLYQEYNDSMIAERNVSMADYAEEVMASGKEVFICVGAAHVVGPGAMADLLAQRGYTVERVSP